MKVLFAASECAPVVKVGGLGDVVGALPKSLKRLGIEVAVIIPRYKVDGFTYPENIPGTDIPVFYIENDAFFGDGSVYPGGNKEYQRFAYFSRAVVEFLDTRIFEPEIIHCHDYHTALIPDILRYQRKKIATVLTIHDLSNKATAPTSVLDTALLSSSHLRQLDWDLTDQNIGMILQGIIGADVINTVSPTYAKEIMTRERGAGLDEILRARESRVYGILNGIDTAEYDPSTDKNLIFNFPVVESKVWSRRGERERYVNRVMEVKRVNKEALQKKLKLKNDPSQPLISLISRLVERKGISLVIDLLEDTELKDAQFIILGKGEPRFEEALLSISRRHPERVSVLIQFDEALARMIYASSDLFLVPSLFEPCGLTQMIAMRYGAVPIVHGVGGLYDSVENNLTGFTVERYVYEDFKKALLLGIELYKNNQLSVIAGNALRKDFSWDKSAQKYTRLYEKALSYKFGISRGIGGEIRRDALGEWTILSTQRKKRPDETGSLGKKIPEKKEKDIPQGFREEIKNCPFEEGNEALSSGEVFRTGKGDPDSKGWITRVVPNKYPILPVHEVIIHSVSHDQDLELFTKEQMDSLIWTYLSRYRHYENYGYVHIFCNRGKEAAASLKHPHSQLIVLDELARSTVEALRASQEYYQHYHVCSYCDLIKREQNGPRMVWQNDSFVIITPFSSDWPFELMILSKTHRKSFGNINEKEMIDFSSALQTAVRALSVEIENISYNYWIHSLPDLLGFDKTSLYYHWHLDLVPRIKVLGGLELGLKLMVNDRISPEEASNRLKSRIN